MSAGLGHWRLRAEDRLAEDGAVFADPLAIRTAKWPVRSSGGTASDRELDIEIDHAIHVAGRVFSALLSRHSSVFPQKREAWFVPSGEDVPE
jgi:hypothetical protein